MAIYALRPLSTGEILDGALTLLRRHFRLVLWIALAFEGVPTVMDVYLDLAGGGGTIPGWRCSTAFSAPPAPCS